MAAPVTPPSGAQPDKAQRPVSSSGIKPVVHLQHGLLGSSTDFVLNGPENSLPLMLADAGEDMTHWDTHE